VTNKSKAKSKETAATSKATVTKKDVVQPKQLAEFTKISATLRLKNVVWLDRLCADIREHTGSLIDRGTVLRGVLAAIHESGIDLGICGSEEQIAETIAKKLRS